jgi:hypothetical protein
VFRKDRLRRGGGVAIFVRGDISAEIVPIDYVHSDVDIIAIDVTFDTQKVRVITCYRPPYYTIKDLTYLEGLLTVLTNLCLNSLQNIVLGDFNLPNIDWDHYTAPNEVCYDRFLDFVNNAGLHTGGARVYKVGGLEFET